MSVAFEVSESTSSDGLREPATASVNSDSVNVAVNCGPCTTNRTSGGACPRFGSNRTGWEPNVSTAGTSARGTAAEPVRELEDTSGEAAPSAGIARTAHAKRAGNLDFIAHLRPDNTADHSGRPAHPSRQNPTGPSQSCSAPRVLSRAAASDPTKSAGRAARHRWWHSSRTQTLPVAKLGADLSASVPSEP